MKRPHSLTLKQKTRWAAPWNSEAHFSILGYSVLSLFVPDMGEYDEPPKVVAGNIVAQTSQVKDIISAVSACFVSAGGSDLIKPKYLSLKPDESLNSQNCERVLS